MAIRRRLIILLCLFTVLVMANPTSAATSTRVNETEDFVDATSNAHPNTPDLGTHSVFGDLQDYGSNYDQMLEENTGGSGIDETDYVTGVAGTLNDWSVTGTPPHLQEGLSDGNYATCEKGGGESYWWTFGDTTETFTDGSVTLYVYISGGDGGDDLNWGVDWTNDGVSDATGTWTNPTTEWLNTGVITDLDSDTEYDNTRMYLQGIAQASYNDPDIDAAYIRVTTAGGDNYELDLEIGWSTADYDESQEYLCIYPVTGGGWPSEAIKVDIWTGTWTNLWADLTPDQWNNISISSYLTGNAVEVRFLGGTETGDTTQDTFEIDAVLIHTYSLAYTEIRYEDTTIDETLSTAAEFARDFTESITFDESLATAITTVLALFEALAVAVSLTTTASLKRFFYEGIAINETLTNALSLFRSYFDSITFDEAVYPQMMVQKYLFESVTINDTLTNVLSASRTFFDSITLDDTVANSISIVKTFFDSITFDETIYAQQMIQKQLFEAVVVTAAIGTAASFSRRFGEQIALASTFNEVGTFAREFFENLIIADYVEATKIAGGNAYEQFLFESITLSDSESLVCSFVRVLSESIVISDTISTTFVGLWIKNLFESFLFSENDVWADYRVTTPTTTFNPDKRRYIIPPIIPPNLVMAGLGGGFIFWIYFYGVPYIPKSEATAYYRRMKLKRELQKIMRPILAPMGVDILPLKRLWKSLWKRLWKTERKKK